MSPRDERGRFVKAPEVPKPWGILMTDSREAGKAIRCVSRRKRNKTALTRRWGRMFETEAEAEQALAELEREGGWRYTVAEF